MASMWRMKTIGERVKWSREQRDITQAQLEEKAGLSTGYVSFIECNRRDPSLGTLKTLAAVLKVDFAWLVAGGSRPVISASKRSA